MALQNQASFLRAALLKSQIILELIKCLFVDKIVLFQEAICSSKKKKKAVFSFLWRKERVEVLAGNDYSLPL